MYIYFFQLIWPDYWQTADPAQPSSHIIRILVVHQLFYLFIKKLWHFPAKLPYKNREYTFAFKINLFAEREKRAGSNDYLLR